MRLRLNMKYLCAFIIVFIIEVLIALFINDKFIRPYVGDILVVVLIYCFIRSFVGIEGKLLPLYILCCIDGGGAVFSFSEAAWP